MPFNETLSPKQKMLESIFDDSWVELRKISE